MIIFHFHKNSQNESNSPCSAEIPVTCMNIPLTLNTRLNISTSLDATREALIKGPKWAGGREKGAGGGRAEEEEEKGKRKNEGSGQMVEVMPGWNGRDGRRLFWLFVLGERWEELPVPHMRYNSFLKKISHSPKQTHTLIPSYSCF